MRPFVVVAVAIVLSACSDASGPKASSDAALIRFAGQDARITVPDTVAAGVPFTVTVQTFGGECVRETDRAEVRYAPRAVSVEVFNRSAAGSGGHTCTADLIFLEHHVTLRIDEPGDVAVRIVGVNRGLETNDRRVPWTVQRVVVVR